MAAARAKPETALGRQGLFARAAWEENRKLMNYSINLRKQRRGFRADVPVASFRKMRDQLGASTPLAGQGNVSGLCPAGDSYFGLSSPLFLHVQTCRTPKASDQRQAGSSSMS